MLANCKKDTDCSCKTLPWLLLLGQCILVHQPTNPISGDAISNCAPICQFRCTFSVDDPQSYELVKTILLLLYNYPWSWSVSDSLFISTVLKVLYTSPHPEISNPTYFTTVPHSSRLAFLSFENKKRF